MGLEQSHQGLHCLPLRSSLVWVYTVCICYFVRNFGVRNFRTFTVELFIITPSWSQYNFNINAERDVKQQIIVIIITWALTA